MKDSTEFAITSAFVAVLTRGHNWKLKSQNEMLDSRLHFFSHSVIKVWNSPSPDTVNAALICSFKALLKLESFDSFLIIKQ